MKTKEIRVKDIPGFEGHYIVADHGQVIATYRQFYINGHLTMRPAMALRAMNDAHGYRQVALCKPGERTLFTFVHRIVAAAFVEPYNGEMVNHKDGNPKNNNWKNLEWCTPQGNTLHYHMRMRGVDLTAREIDEIIALKGVLPATAVARRYNCTRSVVANLQNSRARNPRRRKA